MKTRGIVAILLGLLLVLLVSSLSMASGASQIASQPEDWPTVTLTGSLDLPGIATSGRQGFASANQSKIDSNLANAVANPALASTLRMEDDRVQVQIDLLPEDVEAVRTAVENAGGLVTGLGFEDTVMQAWVSGNSLEAIASEPSVLWIQQPPTPILTDLSALDAELTAGVAASNANAWHSAGLTGQGLKIAIIDGGFTDYPDRLGEELPATVTVRNFVDLQSDDEVDGTTRHGTACAEIAHDMAPGAQIYLLKIATDVDLSQAVNYAISEGVDIISTSLTFINITPGDGTGRFATLGATARDAGIFWATAAGNYRETHWGGGFQDQDGDNFHEFATAQEVNFFGPGNGAAYSIPPGVVLQASIRWDDWTAVNQDYDLHLLRYNGSQFEILRTSSNAQTGGAGQRPREFVVHVTSGLPTSYGVAIERKNSNRNAHFELLTPNRELDKRTTAMSLGNLADVAEVFTIAAVDASIPFPQEDYSSEGPINGPGGAPTGGANKPDLAAFANVDTASYGQGVFNGTSAATPHVAGAAALVLSANPGFSPAQVRSFLEDRAIDQGPPGYDTQFGHGRLHLGPSGASYSIAGTVTTSTGVPLGGVTISAGGGLATQTDGSGGYILDELPAGSYTITAARTGYTFSPSSRDVTVPQSATGQDFVGTQLTYMLSGTVVDSNGQPLPGVWINNGAGRTVQADAAGNYQFTGLPGGTYQLTAALAGYQFVPSKQMVTLPPSGTAAPFTGTPLAFRVLLPVIVDQSP